MGDRYNLFSFDTSAHEALIAATVDAESNRRGLCGSSKGKIKIFLYSERENTGQGGGWFTRID